MNAKTEAPATQGDAFEAAQAKLGAAHGIIDALAVLSGTGDFQALKPGSLCAALLNAEELLDEAKQMFTAAQEREATS